jgi:divalent metal cation (Fe/Co/Zn/Cd) transporter
VSSVAFARYESIRKLIDHGHTTHIAVGIAGAVVGIIGNQVVARYKLVVGKRIGSATLIADARHSWLRLVELRLQARGGWFEPDGISNQPK